LQIPAVGRLLTALAMTSDALVRKGLETSFYDDSKISNDRVAFYYQPLRTSGGQLAVTRAKAQFEMLPIEDKLSTISVPTLIIWGAEDELIPLEAGKRINSLIKGSKLVIIDKCGHVPQEEKPESVINEIENFVN
jgi:pimeloyl-ACP methyl ester carboxylesterase